MKVKALTSDWWCERTKSGEKMYLGDQIKHKKNEIYEVVSKTIIGLSPSGYTIVVGDKYGAISKDDCEIVEGSENDLINNEITNDLILVL